MSEANSELRDVHTLKVIRLNKSFGRREVVKQVSLDAKGGEVVGLLGPNGGKKQPIQLLVCLTTSGMSFWMNST